MFEIITCDLNLKIYFSNYSGKCLNRIYGIFYTKIQIFCRINTFRIYFIYQFVGIPRKQSRSQDRQSFRQ